MFKCISGLVIGIILTVFTFDYISVRKEVTHFKDKAYNAYQCLYEEENGLVWKCFRLENRIEDLENAITNK